VSDSLCPEDFRRRLEREEFDSSDHLPRVSSLRLLGVDGPS